MPAYLIVYGKDPTDRLAAYAYADRKAAWAASLPTSGLVPRVPPTDAAGGCAYVVETAADVPFSGAQLVAVYNGLAGPGVHVNRFESRAVGVQRLLALLPTVAVPPGTVPSPTEEKSMSTDETTANGRGRRPLYDDATAIHLIPNATKARPLREGKKNHGLFEALKALPHPVTAGAARAAGIPSGYLAYYEKHGLIRITPPAAE